ncbi:MAG: glutaredoxin family protein [Luteitalea sp.]|nr:glutaredoxin family protein [Luteitalea sp.]
MVYIYGKDGCPYTQAAIEDHEQRGVAFEYVNVKKDADALARMLKLTASQRRVPVIVDGSSVTVGFAGQT